MATFKEVSAARKELTDKLLLGEDVPQSLLDLAREKPADEPDAYVIDAIEVTQLQVDSLVKRYLDLEFATGRKLPSAGKMADIFPVDIEMIVLAWRKYLSDHDASTN